ncbi:MAG: (Fe-S)-binding protein [Acidimicrobiia bacterium]|nr:(Fe-S)-binding protein [Acidimicrobiia bacterium]MYC45854.1 (Fe-S)-binding protein [Acidimicrobiia bacterium]MYI18909.1 (Fe-S)-binding protein [Acidimicrobiia bacterium]
MRVQFFASCLVELLQPDVGTAAQRALGAAGHEPEALVGATCCGQPAYNAGYGAEARRVARRTLRALGDDDRPCVVASGSCATMMSHHWPELFEGTPEETAARRAARRIAELTAFMTTAGSDAAPDGGTGHDDHADVSDTSRAGGPTAVIVHDSCHALRELGAGATVRRALSDTGHVMVDADGGERCCGFGGSFSVKMPAVSVAMADEKLDSFVATGCEQVTSCDLSCLLHLQGRARRRGLGLRFDHVATLLNREP